jgi:hypothetical protein
LQCFAMLQEIYNKVSTSSKNVVRTLSTEKPCLALYNFIN